MSAGWSKYFSLLLLDKIKTIRIRRRKKKRRAGSQWQYQSATNCTWVFSRHCSCSWGMFLSVCMCVLVSLVSLCVLVYVYVYVSPRPAFQSLLQSKTEAYLTRKIELLCGACFKWVLFWIFKFIQIQYETKFIDCVVMWIDTKKRLYFCQNLLMLQETLPLTSHLPPIPPPSPPPPPSSFFFFLLLSSPFFFLWAKISGLRSTKPYFHLQTFLFLIALVLRHAICAAILLFLYTSITNLCSH